MEVKPGSLLQAARPVCYLHGEDRDALFEAAGCLLDEGAQDVLRIRVDVSELDRVQAELRNTGLFGPHQCHAMIRNAETATPAQGERLLSLAAEVQAPHRLIICAPDISWKKAWHKKMQAHSQVASCCFRFPDQAGFVRWLQQQCEAAGLQLEREVLMYIGERLFGLRQAARQLIDRLQCYRGDDGAPVTMDVVMALLGEKSPDELEDWCHAVAMRQGEALYLTRTLIRDQGVGEVQMLSWLGTRMQQLLMYRWFQSRKQRDPARSAGVFGVARRHIGREAAVWGGRELALAVARIAEAEKQLKGAAIEENPVIMERLVLDLVERGRLHD